MELCSNWLKVVNLLRFSTLLVLSTYCSSTSPALLGVGVKGNGGSSGVSLVGASFNLDIPANGLSRVHGSGLRVDLDVLEIAAARGLVKFTGNSVEYIKDTARWAQVFSEKLIGVTHNAQPVLQLDQVDNSAFYRLTLTGDGTFNDVFLNKEDSVRVLVSFCTADRTVSGEPPEVVARCASDVSSTHLSVQSQLDYVGKLVATLARGQEDAKSALAALKTSGLEGAGSAAESARTKTEVLAEVEGRLDKLRKEVIAENNEHNRAAASLSGEVTALSDRVQAHWESARQEAASAREAVTANMTSLSESVSAQVAALNASLEGVLGEQLESQLTAVHTNISEVLAALANVNETLHANISSMGIMMDILNGNMNSYVGELNNSVLSLGNTTAVDLALLNETLSVMVSEVGSSTTLLVSSLNGTLLELIESTQNSTLERLAALDGELRETLLITNSTLEEQFALVAENASLVEVRLVELLAAGLDAVAVNTSASIGALNGSLALAGESIAALNDSLTTVRDNVIANSNNVTAYVAKVENRLSAALSEAVSSVGGSMDVQLAAVNSSLAELSTVVANNDRTVATSVSELTELLSEAVETLRHESVANNTALYSDLSISLSNAVQQISSEAVLLNTSLVHLIAATAAEAAQDLAGIKHNLTAVIDKNLEALIQSSLFLSGDIKAVNDSLAAANGTIHRVLENMFVEASAQLTAVNASLVLYSDALHKTQSDATAAVKSEAIANDKQLSETIGRVNETLLAAGAALSATVAANHATLTIQVTTWHPSAAWSSA